MAGVSPHHAQWLTQAPTQEGWRVWASFFLGGLYGPIASNYVLRREQWNAAGGTAGAPPAPPSNQGLAVLGLFVGLPTLSILVLGMGAASDVDWSGSGPPSWGVRNAHRWAFFNLPVAWFYVLSVVLARRIEREFAILLHQITAGSRAAARDYARGGLSRALATGVSFAPFVILVSAVVLMRLHTWSDAIVGLSAFYVLSTFVAAWASSWLHIAPLRRFRRAVLAGMP